MLPGPRQLRPPLSPPSARSLWPEKEHDFKQSILKVEFKDSHKKLSQSVTWFGQFEAGGAGAASGLLASAMLPWQAVLVAPASSASSTGSGWTNWLWNQHLFKLSPIHSTNTGCSTSLLFFDFLFDFRSSSCSCCWSDAHFLRITLFYLCYLIFHLFSLLLLFEIHTWIANHIGTDTAGATLTACAIRTHAFWIGALFWCRVFCGGGWIAHDYFFEVRFVRGMMFFRGEYLKDDVVEFISQSLSTSSWNNFRSSRSCHGSSSCQPCGIAPSWSYV